MSKMNHAGGLQISGSTVTFTVQDGALGDDDWAVNREIADPTGPTAAAAAPAAIPALGTWSLALLSALAALLGVRRMHKNY